MKKKVYIAAPYSNGDTVLNIKDAVEAGDVLLGYGFIPFIPHLTGFWHLMFPHGYETWMQYDEEWMKSCDAVLRLPGESSGADRETEVAKTLNIPVCYSLSELIMKFRTSET